MGEVEGSREGAGEDQARSSSGGAGAGDGVAASGGKGEKWREGREREERRQESGRLEDLRRLFVETLFCVSDRIECKMRRRFGLSGCFST